MNTAFDLLDIPSPDDERFPEYAFQLSRKFAATLTRKGWKFLEREGLRGFYFDGINARTGKKILGEQRTTKEEAFLAALKHAHDVEFN